MRCNECVYHWKEEGEKYASCHFERVTCWDVAPCEWGDIDTAEAEAEAEYWASIESDYDL